MPAVAQPTGDDDAGWIDPKPAAPAPDAAESAPADTPIEASPDDAVTDPPVSEQAAPALAEEASDDVETATLESDDGFESAPEDVTASSDVATSSSRKKAWSPPPMPPWLDADPRGERLTLRQGKLSIQYGAEYRAIATYINPIDLSSEGIRDMSWVEQRLRLDTTLDYDDKVRVVVSMDALDGVLWGDNGLYPASNSGIKVAASNPNGQKLGVGYLGEGDATDPDNYGYVLQPAPVISFRRAYGEVATDIGLLRIGRQPTTEGLSLLVADTYYGNRWGYADVGDTVDRALFATKPLEGLKPKGQRDRSKERGVFLITFYDRVATETPDTFADDAQGAGVAIRLRDPQPEKREDLEALLTYSHRWQHINETAVNVVAAQAAARWDKLAVGGEFAYVFGQTREIAESLALIKNDPIEVQSVNQLSGRAVVRWDEPAWTAYFELDYASGDRDPNPGSELSQAVWAEDNNVGLLMFERILAFESARSSAAGIELLDRLGAPSYPSERVYTEGSFTNAFAIFPQVDLRPRDDILLRLGVLAAWAPGGLVDSIISLQKRDGVEHEDDIVNFHGGEPGEFFGVELDARFQWRLHNHFAFDVEGAILFPGEALQDENGHAARSGMIQGRTTFFF
jgi:hypothetical protein